MQYTKKSDKPSVNSDMPTQVVHNLGENVLSGDAQQKGADTNTGPKGAEMFPNTDTWKGKPVTGDYQTVPEDKDAVEENLRIAGEEVQKRFGLETRGFDVPTDGQPEKPDDAKGKSGK